MSRETITEFVRQNRTIVSVEDFSSSHFRAPTACTQTLVCVPSQRVFQGHCSEFDSTHEVFTPETDAQGFNANNGLYEVSPNNAARACKSWFARIGVE